MSEPKFTEGPWAMGHLENGRIAIINQVEINGEKGFARHIANVFHEADANLFLAAPEMYALIKRIHDMLPYFPANMDEMKKVYNEEIPQLLVKARGEA